MSSPENIGERWASEFSVVPAEVEAEFDAEAAVYDSNVHSWGYRSAVDGAQILSKYVDTSATILDAGCGTGLVGAELRRLQFTRLYGCDLSSSMMEVAKKKDIYLELKKANLCERMPYDDSQFDGLTCLATLSFVEDAEPAFREFCRVTKPNAIILFSQRCDLFETRDCRSLLQKLEAEGLWQREFHSDPHLYLPEHSAYTDRLQVGYYVYRVLNHV